MTGSADKLEEPAKGVASQNKYLTLGGCQGDGAQIGEIFGPKQTPADDGKRRGDWTFCLPFKRRGSGGGNGIRFSFVRGAGG